MHDDICMVISICFVRSFQCVLYDHFSVLYTVISGCFADQLEHSGLARQVSTLLTNHLTRATECSGNEAAGNEALHEVLSLLNSLSRWAVMSSHLLLLIIMTKIYKEPYIYHKNYKCIIL